jgi:hypothetical protein
MTIRSISVEHKCGGCNWESSTAYYYALEGVPECDKELRLDHGLCASCFMDMLTGKDLFKPKHPTVWIEFFSLREDSGVTFRAMEAHLCGGILRIKFGEDDWKFVESRNGYWYVEGSEWTDCSVAAERYNQWKVVNPKKLKGLFE